MSTQIQITPSSDIEVGTTPVTSGTDGRVFFQAGGVVQQDSSFFWDNTNKRLGIGGVPDAYKLDVIGGIRIGSSPNIGNKVYFDDTTFRLGIGIASPTRKLDVVEGSSGLVANFRSNSGNISAISLSNNSSTADQIRFGSNGTALTLSTNYTERARIDINGLFGIGTTSPQARLDVRAQGALSTDIAFRVRNSANTLDILSVQGDTKIIQNINPNTALTYPGFNVAGNNTNTYISVATSGNQPMETGFSVRGSQGNNIKIFADTGNVSGVGQNTTHVWFSGGGGYSYFGAIGNNNYGFKFGFTSASTLSNTNGTLGMLIKSTVNSNQSILSIGTYLGTTTGLVSSTYGGNTFFIVNGTAPSATHTDTFALYSADIVAGNAAPHFRTENGSIIKIYQETTGVAAAALVGGGGTTITDTDTFGGYTLQQIAQVLKNLGILA